MQAFSRKQIRDKVRFQFDITNFGNPTDDQLNDVIQDAVDELWDIAIVAAPPHRFSKDYPLSVVGGTITYDIDSLIPNFRSLQKLFLVEDVGAGRWRELSALPGHLRGHAEAPASSCSLIVRYTPEPPVCVDDTYEFIGGIPGGIVFLMQSVCERIAIRERRDSDMYRRAKFEASERIVTQLRRRDEGGILEVLDVEERDNLSPWTGWNTVMWYQLRDTSIDIFSSRVNW